ncbi:hypothetical protein CMZ82_12440 [Lysobacteraceae bacterium NML93-0792]|nr:hypothetical protein CMZ82_12440 [Xanthomonadaceae bacterium NML93-0792]PBS16157.1 hypothetical protein CMZ81_07510 [Xanthomonadaceae bacterium NML93-0793]PBS20183.1 hypothetical protein CMZ80_04275 [Xanthomonadaceae bacterium NML93-0831]
MSIVNVSVSPGRAIVAVDTAVAGCRIGDLPTTGRAQKAHIIGTAVIAGRGNVGMLKFVCLELMNIDAIADVDLIVASLPMVLPRAKAHLDHAQAQAGGVAGPYAQGCELAVVGWSQQRGALRAITADFKDDGRVYLDEIHSTCAGPGIPGAESMDMSTPVAMQTLARAQVAHLASVDPEAPIGGELIVYEVMQGGIIMRQMGAI